MSVPVQDVAEAAARLVGVAHRTPHFHSRTLDERLNAKLVFKGEHLQTYGLTCVSCHKMHRPAGMGSLHQDEKALCESCHPVIRSKTLMPSHHPLREGKMTCTSCHDMMGDAMIDLDRPNDLCGGRHRKQANKRQRRQPAPNTIFP